MPTDSSRNRSPIMLDGYAVYSEFFPMLDVPFHYGHGWSAQDDAARLPVAVISDKLNRQVFGGGNSVGKTIDIDNHDYRIVGVTHDWNPQPRFFDVEGGYYSVDGPDVFLPFQHAVAVNMINAGWDGCRKGTSDPQGDFVGLQHSDCVWIAYMAELDDAAAVQRYRQYLDDYASDQQKAGRFRWAPNNRLRDLPAFLDLRARGARQHKRVAAGGDRPVDRVPGEHDGPVAGQVPAAQRRDRHTTSAGGLAQAPSMRSS